MLRCSGLGKPLPPSSFLHSPVVWLIGDHKSLHTAFIQIKILNRILQDVLSTINITRDLCLVWILFRKEKCQLEYGYGYARVSSTDQNEERQIIALRENKGKDLLGTFIADLVLQILSFVAQRRNCTPKAS